MICGIRVIRIYQEDTLEIHKFLSYARTGGFKKAGRVRAVQRDCHTARLLVKGVGSETMARWIKESRWTRIPSFSLALSLSSSLSSARKVDPFPIFPLTSLFSPVSSLGWREKIASERRQKGPLDPNFPYFPDGSAVLPLPSAIFS